MFPFNKQLWDYGTKIEEQVKPLIDKKFNADFKKKDIKLPIALGKNISGKPIVGDLASMPHLLIAGTTGSGKSVCINTIILSLLYRHTPDKCKFILIDPKMLELSTYEGILQDLIKLKQKIYFLKVRLLFCGI